MSDQKLLVVEDDPNLGQILQEYLGVKGYEADLATDGQMGLKMFKDRIYDLCILDIMLPKKDGFTLAKEIHIINQEIPFIFLTAKSMKTDTMEGFLIGADDYITKPFSMEELLLRINAILRRTERSKPKTGENINIGRFKFNPEKQILQVNGVQTRLTTKENELLHLLYLNKHSFLDRSIALKKIWRNDTYFNARSMDVYIAKLRKHLKTDDSVQIITLHGQGFRLVDIN